MKFLKIFYLLFLLQTVAIFSSDNKSEEARFPQLAARLTPACYPHPPSKDSKKPSRRDRDRGKTLQKIGGIIVGVSHETHNDLNKLLKIRRDHEEAIIKHAKRLDLALKEADIIATHMRNHADILERTSLNTFKKLEDRLARR